MTWNGLRTKKVLTRYKNTICFGTPLCYILSCVHIAWLKFGNQYLVNAGVVLSTIACQCYCLSPNPVGAKFQHCKFCPSTVTLPNSNGCLNRVQVANGLVVHMGAWSTWEPMILAASGNKIQNFRRKATINNCTHSFDVSPALIMLIEFKSLTL